MSRPIFSVSSESASAPWIEGGTKNGDDACDHKVDGLKSPCKSTGRGVPAELVGESWNFVAYNPFAAENGITASEPYKPNVNLQKGRLYK